MRINAITAIAAGSLTVGFGAGFASSRVYESNPFLGMKMTETGWTAGIAGSALGGLMMLRGGFESFEGHPRITAAAAAGVGLLLGLTVGALVTPPTVTNGRYRVDRG